MKTILSIFRSDISSLSRRFFALAIIVAVSVLPALYAWVNIYASMNPYANTKGMKIALASRDPGITLDDGTYVNSTDEVFEDMKDDDDFGWQFPATADEAIEGVKSGKYYAAIIFEDNFTYNMHHFEQAVLDGKAPLTYYENGKINAVAPKITETAASNLQEDIKTKYLETVFKYVFDETNDMAEDIEDTAVADTLIGQLADLRDTLRAYDSAISTFTGNSSSVHSGLSGAHSNLTATRKAAKRSAATAGSDLNKARRSLVVLKKVLENREQRIANEISELEAVINKIKKGGLSDEEMAALMQKAMELANALKSDLEGLLSLFPESSGSAIIDTIRGILVNMINDLDTLSGAMDDLQAVSVILEELKSLSKIALSGSVDSLIKTMDRTLELMEPLMGSMSDMLSDMDPVLKSADNTVSSLDDSLHQLQELFRTAADRADEIIDKVGDVSADSRLQTLMDLMGGDPELYSKFFSSLVVMDVEKVYSSASYGAAMTPFYSVLAIWVGGVMLVAILKTHIDRKKFPQATESQAFFGRFILLFLIGQVQAAVIVAGDIFLFKCAPVHPWLMWLAAAVSSLVFVMIIYSLTISFGDIGKALVVVIMVLQIAGSSGSYPIEILPTVFGKIYKFFPFPYAINAIREAMCGLYGSDYVKYLAELLIFAAFGLTIGLFVRRPFLRMTRFVAEKLEETEVL